MYVHGESYFETIETRGSGTCAHMPRFLLAVLVTSLLPIYKYDTVVAGATAVGAKPHLCRSRHLRRSGFAVANQPTSRTNVMPSATTSSSPTCIVTTAKCCVLASGQLLLRLHQSTGIQYGQSVVLHFVDRTFVLFRNGGILRNTVGRTTFSCAVPRAS